ncbi:UNVERIFIED_CONTAM: hypothetical protein Slati_2397100 [Sesamum latifolium]|uniref:Uncharacterized protein n=1 Tax=Sesamum latifolium TaxID=2727402 RepID=A0AAW2WEG0_9LAMI
MAIIPERTIKDMTSPDLNQPSLCIEYLDLEVNFELKSGLIHLLPTFRGLAGEDPHKHLKKFHVVYSGMRPQRITEQQVVEKYFPASRAITIRKEINETSQFAGESMDKKLIDVASGGALFNKTPIEAHNLISIMASNTQQFRTGYDDPPRRSNKVSIAAFGDQLNELTSLVKKITVEKHHVKACGICTSPKHATDMFPTLQKPPTEHARIFRTDAKEI